MRRIIAVVVVVLVALAIPFVATAESDELDGLKRESRQVHEDGLYQLAAWYYRQLFDFSGDIDYLYFSATFLENANLFDEAIQVLGYAISKETEETADGCHMASRYYEKINEPDSVLKYLYRSYDMYSDPEMRQGVSLQNMLGVEASRIAFWYYRFNMLDSSKSWLATVDQHVLSGYFGRSDYTRGLIAVSKLSQTSEFWQMPRAVSYFQNVILDSNTCPEVLAYCHEAIANLALCVFTSNLRW